MLAANVDETKRDTIWQNYPSLEKFQESIASANKALVGFVPSRYNPAIEKLDCLRGGRSVFEFKRQRMSELLDSTEGVKPKAGEM